MNMFAASMMFSLSMYWNASSAVVLLAIVWRNICFDFEFGKLLILVKLVFCDECLGFSSAGSVEC